MALSDEFLDDLRRRADIESTVSSYVSLKRKGKILTGLCPFHNEKTPSFTVYPETQSYYCFGSCWLYPFDMRYSISSSFESGAYPSPK